MAILVLILILAQVITKSNRKFAKHCLVKLLLLVWQAPCGQRTPTFAVGDFLFYLFIYLFYLWFAKWKP